MIVFKVWPCLTCSIEPEAKAEVECGGTSLSVNLLSHPALPYHHRPSERHWFIIDLQRGIQSLMVPAKDTTPR